MILQQCRCRVRQPQQSPGRGWDLLEVAEPDEVLDMELDPEPRAPELLLLELLLQDLGVAAPLQERHELLCSTSSSSSSSSVCFSSSSVSSTSAPSPSSPSSSVRHQFIIISSSSSSYHHHHHHLHHHHLLLQFIIIIIIVIITVIVIVITSPCHHLLLQFIITIIMPNRAALILSSRQSQASHTTHYTSSSAEFRQQRIMRSSVAVVMVGAESHLPASYDLSEHWPGFWDGKPVRLSRSPVWTMLPPDAPALQQEVHVLLFQGLLVPEN